MTLLIETGTGISQATDGYEAGRCAAHEAISDIRQFPLSVVIIYASVHYDLDQVLAGVGSVAGSTPILGTTTAGEICQGVHQHSVTVVAIASPHLSVHAAVGNGVSADWQSALNQAIDNPAISAYVTGKQYLTSDFTSSGKSLFAMIFYPGNTRTVSSMGYEILETFKRISLGRIPVFGGASADDWRMESNSVFLGSRVHNDSIVIAIFETQLEIGIGLSHGFLPVGEKMNVIASDGHELISLDHASAADTIANRMGKQRVELEGQHLTLTTGFPLGSPDPMNQYSVNIASYFTPRGGVRMTQPVSVGTELTLLTYDSENSILAGQEALRKSMIRAGTNAPALILVHYCALRPRIMGETLAQAEISKLQQIAGAASFAGFFSFGEDAVADDGVSRHNNGAVAVLVLGKQFSAMAKVAQENKRLLSQISEQERAEAANLSRVMFENSPSGMVAIDPVTGLIVQANNRELDMFGYSKDELLARTMLDVTHPEDRAKSLQQYEQLSKGLADSLRYEKRFIRKDGSCFWAEVNLSAFKDINGKISLIIGNAVDITERKQAEIALKHSKDQLAAILNATMESIILVDVAGIVLALNDTAAKRFRLKPTDMLGRCIWNFVPPELVDSRRKYIEQVFLTGKEKYSEDTRNGYCFSINYYPFMDNDGKVGAVVIYAADITERRNYQLQLERLLIEQKALLDNDLIGIVTVKDRKIIWANRAYEKMLGYEPGECDGTPTRQNYPSEEVYQALGAAAYPVLLAGGVYRSQVEHVGKDGKHIWFDISGTILNKNTTESLWGFVDITERIQAEVQIKKSLSLLQTTLESTADAILVVDLNNVWVLWNQQFIDLWDIPGEIIASKDDKAALLYVANLLVDPEGFADKVNELHSTPKARSFETIKFKDGRVVERFSIPQFLEGEVVGRVWSFRDVTDRKHMEDQVYQLAFYDPLTRLANRRLLTNRLDQALASSKRTGLYGALIFLDLDNFKPLNDAHGHNVGDSLLVEVANRISSCIRETDTVARFGGDEFVVMLAELEEEESNSASQAGLIAEKIRVALSEPYILNIQHDGQVVSTVEHHCTSSMGAVLFNSKSNMDDILELADDAMYRAKQLGRNRVVVNRSSGLSSTAPRSLKLKLSWDASYECGEPTIDQDHLRLVYLSNQLIDKALARETNPQELNEAWENLLSHVTQHFAEEEKVLAQYNYPDLDSHIAAHKVLINHALELRDNAARNGVTIGDLVNFLADEVVTQHMLKTDRLFYYLFGKT